MAFPTIARVAAVWLAVGLVAAGAAQAAGVPGSPSGPAPLPAGAHEAPSGYVPAGAHETPSGYVPAGAHEAPSGHVPAEAHEAPSGHVPAGAHEAPSGHVPAGAHEATGHAAGPQQGLNPLDFKADLAIYTVVVFVVLLGILWKLAWGPIVRGLDQRAQRIRNEILSAEKANAQAQQLLAEYQAKLAAAEGQVRELLERGRAQAEQLSRELLDRTRSETQVEKQRALREIELARTAALKELAEHSATLAIELAGKILQARLDPAVHAELIRRAMDQLPVRSGPQA